MHQDTQYHCYYLDHTFFDVLQIAKFYTNEAREVPLSEKQILLATCQRIEVYTTTPTNPFAEAGLPFRHISGRKDVRNRLIAIASGAYSQILGEKNIYLQVRNACRDCPDNHQLRPLFDKALKSAATIRNQTNFAAIKDYEDVAFHMLKKVCPESHIGTMNLMIFGSGMLARNFLEKSIAPTYSRILFITRSPRNLRKKLEGPLKKCVIRHTELDPKEVSPYHCIIATNKVTHDGYDDGIRRVLTHSNCKGVFDLSAVPIFQKDAANSFYVDTYSPAYLSCVGEYNLRNTDKKQQVLELVQGLEHNKMYAASA